jgi:hypothetical protein
MPLSLIARRALTAAVVAAAGAAGSYAFRHYMDRRTSRRARKEDKIDESRWEGEGGSPPDLTAAVPHQPLSVR